MLELEAAQARILSSLPRPVAETVPLANARGRVLASPVISKIDLPPFDNSAMDGYAVRAADVGGATIGSPARLRLIGRIPAGAIFSGTLEPGTCARLFTGSPVPCGADAVVMQEDTSIDPKDAAAILVNESVNRWENVRLQGEDVKSGAHLGTRGDVMSIGHLALLAATGCLEISAGRQPRVGLLATGSELKEAGSPLEPGQIYESNRGMLAALAQKAGAISKTYPLVPDRLDTTRLKLSEAFRECEIVITSGGVSVGEMDFVKQAFEEIGGTMQFWKVAIRPGRPFVFGQLNEKFLFGLPGNPVSALVTFLLLVRPALLKWQGASESTLPSHPARLAEPVTNAGNRRHFMRLHVSPDGTARSAGPQASHILSSVMGSNGLLDLAPGRTFAAGEMVSVMRWEI
jgi:molybdopterin molybdotransferase